MKQLSMLLVIIMLLCLCACGKRESQNADSNSNSNPGHNITSNAKEPTNSTTEDEHESTTTSTPNSTTTSTPTSATTPGKGDEGNKDNPIPIPTPDKDKQDSAQNPTTPPTDEGTTDPTDPTACQHTYTVATCTIPKICTKCEEIAGNTLPHNYKNGACTVCGKPEILVNFKEGDWVAHIVKKGTNSQGEILSQYILTQDKLAYSNVVCYSNASSCIINVGKVIYNEKTYYADWYPTSFTRPTWKEDGDTITITIKFDDTTEFVLTKTSETQLTVISSTNTVSIPVGIVFEKQ